MQSLMTLLAVAVAGLALAVTPVGAQGSRVEYYPIPTVTLTEPEFLTGAQQGKPATIAGELRLPRGRPGRLPAVLLVHGSGGVGDRPGRWAAELNGLGIASFVPDSFSSRGLTETGTNQAELPHVAMIVDAYRALALLAAHPRIDPARIAIMGFSKGGFVALYSSLKRFQRMHAPAGLQFAAHVAFYPICARTYIDDEVVSERPIRIFHGEADDWLPIEHCRRYVARLQAAGRDASLTAYPGARHGFDAEGLAPMVRLPNVQRGPRCLIDERPAGVMVNRETGQPFTFDDACVERGATIGYDPQAYQQALAAVKALFTATLKPGG
jgi:dienelactone hydrolase